MSAVVEQIEKVEVSFSAVTEETVARFWAKVNKDGPIPAHTPELGPCWLWTASLRSKGYGAFTYSIDGIIVQDRAHRFSFVLHGGILDDNQCALHRCDVPACVNPAHLFAGTKAANNADMCEKGRHAPGGSKTPVSECKYTRGIEHPNARLSDDLIARIRKQRSEGWSFGKLSREHGIAISYIFRIIKGTARKEVSR